MFNYGVQQRLRGMGDCDFFRRCNRSAPLTFSATQPQAYAAYAQQQPQADCSCKESDNSFWFWLIVAALVGYNLKGK